MRTHTIKVRGRRASIDDRMLVQGTVGEDVLALDLDEEWYRSLNAVYREREVKGFELLDLIGCSYAKPQSGLFVWGRLPEGAGDCFEFSDKLLYGCGVFITPGGIFGSEGNNYIRISLCSPVEVLERAKQRIREKM